MQSIVKGVITKEEQKKVKKKDFLTFDSFIGKSYSFKSWYKFENPRLFQMDRLFFRLWIPIDKNLYRFDLTFKACLERI